MLCFIEIEIEKKLRERRYKDLTLEECISFVTSFPRAAAEIIKELSIYNYKCDYCKCNLRMEDIRSAITEEEKVTLCKQCYSDWRWEQVWSC